MNPQAVSRSVISATLRPAEDTESRTLTSHSLDELLPSIHLVTELSISAPDMATFNASGCVEWLERRAMPLLEKLEITVSPLQQPIKRNKVPRIALVQDRLPKLAELRLQGVSITSWGSPVLAQLKVIELREYPSTVPNENFTNFLSGMQGSTSLERLTVVNFLGVAEPTLPEGFRAPFPNLVELTVRDLHDKVAYFMQHLDVPVCKTVRLMHYSHPAVLTVTDAKEAIVAVSQAKQPQTLAAYQTGKKVPLKKPWMPSVPGETPTDDLFKMLMHFPSLSSLMVLDSTGDDIPLTIADVPNSEKFPQLKRLSVLGARYSGASVRVLELLRYKLLEQPNGGTLESLEAVFAPPKPGTVASYCKAANVDSVTVEVLVAQVAEVVNQLFTGVIGQIEVGIAPTS